MKLPERLKLSDWMMQHTDVREAFEAIIRDCAIMCDKIVIDHKIGLSSERKVARLCKEAILSRYEIDLWKCK